MYAYTNIYTCLHIQRDVAYTYTHIYVSTHTHVSTYTHRCSIHTDTHVCLHIHIHVDVSVAGERRCGGGRRPQPVPSPWLDHPGPVAAAGRCSPGQGRGLPEGPGSDTPGCRPAPARAAVLAARATHRRRRPRARALGRAGRPGAAGTYLLQGCGRARRGRLAAPPLCRSAELRARPALVAMWEWAGGASFLLPLLPLPSPGRGGGTGQPPHPPAASPCRGLAFPCRPRAGLRAAAQGAGAGPRAAAARAGTSPSACAALLPAREPPAAAGLG